MSEGLVEWRLLSSGYMSTERPVITWSSRLRNRRSTFSNRRCFFINKLQISVLINYILVAWNTFKTKFHDTITVFFFLYNYANKWSHPQKLRTFEKILPHGNFLPGTLFRSWFLRGNTLSEGPKSLVPGESSYSGNRAIVLFLGVNRP